MSGGGGSGSSTSYSTNLPQYARPYYEELLKQTGKNIFDVDAEGFVTGVKDYQPYQGDRLAGFTQLQQQAQAGTGALTTPGDFATSREGMQTGQNIGYNVAAQGLGTALNYTPVGQQSAGQFGAAEAAQYMSPYQQYVTDIAKREARLQGDLGKQSNALSSISRGTFGGARQALLQAEGERNVQQNIADIQAKGSQAAYESAQAQYERDREAQFGRDQFSEASRQYGANLGQSLGLAGLSSGLQASQGLGALGATQQEADLQRLQAQAAAGKDQQTLNQDQLDIAYQQDQEAKNYERQLLEYYSNILRGNASALGSTQVRYTPPPSAASQLGGLGLAAYGLSQR